MISGFFIFNRKGEVIISRLYRADIRRSIADIFRIHILASPQAKSPISPFGSGSGSTVSIFHITVENIYIMAASKQNANAALIFEFLNHFSNICRSYFGKMDEEAVKNNFVLIYELLDEILDFGYPQISDVEVLKMYIMTEGYKSEKAVKEDSSKITVQATGAISWRRPGITYRKNEVFVDVIESVDLLLSSQGTVLRADASGQIMMRSFLTGMPECRFGLNDKMVTDKEIENGKNKQGSNIALDDYQFHQCVRLGKFNSTRMICFVPPDGEFELMRYRTTKDVQLPFKVTPIVNEINRTRVEYKVSVRSTFPRALYAQNIVVKIPTPLNTANTNMRCSYGKTKYVGADNVMVWKINKMRGGQEFIFSADADLTSMTVRKTWSRPPISMDFQVLMFTCSGLQVKFLKVYEKANYKSVKWVRYMSKAGSYQVKI